MLIIRLEQKYHPFDADDTDSTTKNPHNFIAQNALNFSCPPTCWHVTKFYMEHKISVKIVSATTLRELHTSVAQPNCNHKIKNRSQLSVRHYSINKYISFLIITRSIAITTNENIRYTVLLTCRHRNNKNHLMSKSRPRINCLDKALIFEHIKLCSDKKLHPFRFNWK